VNDPKLAERITAAVLAELNKPSEAPAPPPRVYTSAELLDSAPKGVYKPSQHDGYSAFVDTSPHRVAMIVYAHGTTQALWRHNATQWLPDPTREARVTFVPAGGAA
jgi:hypothetical protein